MNLILFSKVKSLVTLDTSSSWHTFGFSETRMIGELIGSLTTSVRAFYNLEGLRKEAWFLDVFFFCFESAGLG